MEAKRVRRRKHSAEFKAGVIHACRQPQASVAAIALRSGLNANLVHRWLRQDGGALDGAGDGLATLGRGHSVEFVPVQMPQPEAPAPSADIRMEIRRGACTVTVNWPVQSSAQCGAWLREWLR